MLVAMFGSPAALGAGLALALDLVVLVAAVVLRSSQTGLLDIVVVAALGGALALPIAGWVAGPAGTRSRREGLTKLVAAAFPCAAIGWALYVVAFLVVLGPPGGPGTELGFLLYALAWMPLGIVLLLLLWLPVIAAWTFAMPIAWRALSSDGRSRG